MNRQTMVFIGIGVVIAGIVGFFGYWWFATQRPSNKIERTLAMIKPDAVKAMHTGKIIDQIEHAGFVIVDFKKVHLDKERAEEFYEMHKGRKFFADLVDMMISGPVVVMVLEKMNGIKSWRELMGDTDPMQAKEGTIRKQFGVDKGKNAVHGSDSPEAAEREIKFFFADRIR